MDNYHGRLGGSWRLTTTGALTGALFVTYLVALSPHLVHHLFDEDHGRPACPHLAQSQQTPELQPDPPQLIPPIQIATVQVLSPGVSLPSPALALSNSRAPPFSTRSA